MCSWVHAWLPWCERRQAESRKPMGRPVKHHTHYDMYYEIAPLENAGSA